MLVEILFIIAQLYNLRDIARDYGSCSFCSDDETNYCFGVGIGGTSSIEGIDGALPQTGLSAKTMAIVAPKLAEIAKLYDEATRCIKMQMIFGGSGCMYTSAALEDLADELISILEPLSVKISPGEYTRWPLLPDPKPVEPQPVCLPSGEPTPLWQLVLALLVMCSALLYVPFAGPPNSSW